MVNHDHVLPLTLSLTLKLEGHIAKLIGMPRNSRQVGQGMPLLFVGRHLTVG